MDTKLGRRGDTVDIGTMLHSGNCVQGSIELFAPGGYKAKLHSRKTFLINKYSSTNNKY